MRATLAQDFKKGDRMAQAYGVGGVLIESVTQIGDYRRSFVAIKTSSGTFWLPETGVISCGHMDGSLGPVCCAIAGCPRTAREGGALCEDCHLSLVVNGKG